MMKYYAHSVPNEPQRKWQTIRNHAKGVAERAGKSAQKFKAQPLAVAAGILHDIGKYSADFQRKLEGENRRVDHSTAGAHVAATDPRFGVMGQLLAYIIAGHHAGLANGDRDGPPTPLKDRLDVERIAGLPKFDEWRRELEDMLPATLALPTLKSHMDPDIAKQRLGVCTSLFTRMLFSVLVDADRLDTEEFYARFDDKTRMRGAPPDILRAMKVALDDYLARVANHAAKNDLNKARAEILANTRAKAVLPPGLFSLTVPTGGGKTLSSLAFALEHAAAHPDRIERVIYVIPFTSIIEQTAAVFRKAFGEDLSQYVIEHHSAYREPDDNERIESDNQAGERTRLASDNWDAPIIVTTAVQFFESLFSNRTGRCRKLHNICKSVVILDEAQTLPLNLLRPCVAVLDELARNYSTSIVVCTATHPAITARRRDGAFGFHGGLDIPKEREIAPEPEPLYERLRRVTVKAPKTLDDDELVAELHRHEKVLCIVGTRAHARELYRKLEHQEGTHHLSALMCPAHRSQKLAKIKSALKVGPCRVIATTVVEAGVDIDFPCVYRAMAGLDSIAQAAGRCNREGKFPIEESIVQLFEMADRKSIPELRKYEETAREILRQPQFRGDPLSLAAIEVYFSRLYWRQEQGRDDGLDEHGIANGDGKYRINNREMLIPFAEVARDFRVIENRMEPVIIPWGDEAKKLIRDLESAERPGRIPRKLQAYMVNVPKDVLVELRRVGAVQPVSNEKWDERLCEQFLKLTNDDIYFDDIGFDWSDRTFRHAERLVF